MQVNEQFECTGLMSERQLRLCVAAAIFAVVVGFYISARGGCSGVRKSGMYTLTKQNFGIPEGERLRRFAGAETLRNIKTKELIDEVINVVEQGGLPADVFVGLSVKDSKDTQQSLQLTNIAVTLYDQFFGYDMPNPNDYQKSLKDDLDTLWEASPVGEWNADEQQLASVKAVLARLEPKRKVIRDKLLEPETHFYYIFDHPKSLSFSTATRTVVDTWASKYLADYALLEEYAIAQALLEGNITEAINALKYILRIAQLASALDNVGVRADAAVVRLRAFDVMQRVVLDPKFNKTHMIDLRETLSEQHENWTPEFVTWFGDRASGMMLYHRILTEGSDNALEPAQLASLEERGIQSQFIRGFKKYYEADEAFYLRSMQKILDVSNEPFLQRLEVLSYIDNELSTMEGMTDEDGISTEYFVASFMLNDVEDLMEVFAKDQSALDRALVATLKSLGQGNTDSYHDPLSGKPYEVSKAQGLFSVSAMCFSRDHPSRYFRVPVFTDKE